MTLVVGVEYRFDQNCPNAGMVCRMGMCRAFETLGIPYLLADLADLATVLPSVPNPVCWLSGPHYDLLDRRTLRELKRHPLFVWVDPWFEGSDRFYDEHGYEYYRRVWTDARQERVLASQPRFVYYADPPSRAVFFEKWARRGLRTVSLPLACDTSLYTPDAPRRPEFVGIRMAFVGGYWAFKGRQIDKYLRPFEDDLVIYGYSPWPYKGYRGQLARDAEPSLYRQALVSPTINEPQVTHFIGLNERVFKVLGSGGATVVDAVPAYRELFAEDELPIPADEEEFAQIVGEMLKDEDLRQRYSRRGYEAVMARHTYLHRAGEIVKELGFALPAEREKQRHDGN